MKKILLFLFALVCTCFVLNAQTYNATVAKDGSGTHTTVAAAIASAPTNSTSTYYIFVKAGVYYEKDTVPTNRPNITMVGENVLTTVIYYNDNATVTLLNGSPIGTSGSASFFVNGASFTAANLTFQNNAADGTSNNNQSVAVNISGDKASFRNCRFLGRQDVLYCKNSGISSYFKNCYIDGTVDFIFGASTSWFDSCYIFCKSRATGGVICAPNTAAGTSFGSPWGFVFNGCKINGASDMTGQYYLGRPWQNKPQAVYLNTNMSSVIKDSGWSRASAGSATTSDVSFGEYNSSGAGYSSTARVNFSSQLDATQYSNYSIANVLGGWDPCTSTVSSMCSAVDLPVATANFSGTQTSGSSASLSWNMCWPLAMTYTIKRSNNGGSFSTLGTTNGTATNFNYSTSDNSMPTGVNRYILQMTYSGTTYTSTDTVTISNQPTITSSVSSLSAFAQTIGSPSSSQNFTISGVNLSANITATAPTNFQVSTNNSTWSTTATFTQSGGTVSSSLLYVRLNAGSNGTYSGNVALTTTGGTTVNVAVSGTTSTAPAYVATLLQEWILTSNNSDNSATRAVGINSSTPTANKLYGSDNATVITGSTTMPAFSSTFGMGFGPSLNTTSSNGNWATTNNGPGGSLSRIFYQQFTISGASGYTERIDSILLNAACYNSANGRMAIVYSKNGFSSPADSTDVTSGGTLNGTTLGATAYGSFTNFIALGNQTSSGPTNLYRIPLNGSTGVSLTSGQTLTVRLYFAVGSGSNARYVMLKNVQFKGSVTPPPPTITSFTPTAQISGGSVVITGTNFSGVTAVSFGGTPAATNYTVNSGGTQITAVVTTGTTGTVSVTTGSGTATSSGTFTFQTPTTYYNVANADVTDVNNWGTNTDGSGTHPSNFTDVLQTFEIYNSGATMSGPWTVSGTNSKISVNANAAVFNQTQTITGTVNIENDGDLEVKTATAPTFGTLFSGSTVGYSGTIDQTITAANYYNLTLTGSGLRTFPSGVVGIASQFTTNSYTSAGAGTIVSFNGTSPQTIPPFTYDSLIINNSNGCITQGGGSSVVANKGVNILQNLTVDAGDTWVMAGNNGAAFSVASGKVLTVSGTLDNQSTGLASWGSLVSSPVSNASTGSSPDSASFVVNSGGIYKINALVANSYGVSTSNFKSGSELRILQGSPRLPLYIGGNVTWATTGAGTLTQQTASVLGGDLTISAGQINNGTGGTGRTVTVLGNLIVNGGEYDVNGNTAGTAGSQVLNVYGTIQVSSGNLYATTSTVGGTGTINVYGNISHTGGNIGQASTAAVGGSIAMLGTTAQTVSTTGFANRVSLSVNNTNGVTITGNTTVGTLTLTNGVVTMGSSTITASSVSKVNGWVNGKLSKNINTGTNVSTSFEIGDASNYLPVDLLFANVYLAGNVAVSVNSPISAVPHYATSVVSPINYINRFWTFDNVNSLIFSTYSATLNYKAADLVGSATSASVYGYLYSSSWSSLSISSGSNANTVSGAGILGNIILGNDCTPTTPTVGITIVGGSSTVCSGSSVTFNAVGTNDGTTPTYQWKKNGSNLIQGTSITFSPNSLHTGDVITCELTSDKPCITTTTVTSNPITLTVNQSPVVASISSQYGSSTTAFAMCTLGGVVTLYPSVANGIWSSSGSTIATVVRGNSSTYSANVTAIANGSTNITYTLTTPNTTCSTGSTIVVTVAQQAAPSTISTASGLSVICVNAVDTFKTSSTGGVWSTAGRATITTGGVATGSSAGTTAVKYTITNASGCSNSASYAVTINPLPAVPSIAFLSGTSGNVVGSGGYCKNRTFTLVGSPAGGSWGSSGVISVSGAGVVNTGSVAGACSVTYTYVGSNACSNSRTITSNIVACASKGITNNQLATSIDQIVVYPNPTRSVINLNVKTLIGAGSIIVTDLYGKQLKQQTLSIGTNSIDVSTFAKGMYMISIITDAGKQTQKVIVE